MVGHCFTARNRVCFPVSESQAHQVDHCDTSHCLIAETLATPPKLKPLIVMTGACFGSMTAVIGNISSMTGGA